MARSKSTITESYTIPSAGSKIYQGIEIPDTFTLRAMTTIEEKMRLASSDGFKVIPQIIKACCVDPEATPDLRRLKIFDLQFLMYKLRVVTYGPNYEISITCPYCGKTNKIEIDLDTIPVNEVPSDFTEPFEIGPLPVNGDILGCRFTTTLDYENINREARRIMNKYPDYVGDPEFIIKWNYILLTKNGEEMSAREIQPYIEGLNAKDLRYLESKYDKISSSFGLDIAMVEKCSACDNDIEFTLPMTSEFFRPEY